MTSKPHAETSTPSRAPEAVLLRRLLPRSDGPRYRQLTLELDAGGAIVLTWHEIGAEPDAAWRADDNEVMLRVRGAAMARLAFGLLEERLQGRMDGLDDLQAFCVRHGVDHDLACWT